jgi:hypothetical protein
MRLRWRSIPSMVTGVSLLLAACDRQPVTSVIPTPIPQPMAPAPSGPSVTLTGTVSDTSAAPVIASVGAYPLRWANAWSGPPRTTQTDAAGHFRFAALPQHPDVVYVRAWKDGYVQQCATAVTLHNDASLSLTVTPYASVVTTGLATVAGLRQVGGTVFERRNGERRPAAGVWVGWEPILDTVVADTRTDAEGRYKLCGLPRDRIDLFAVRVGTNRPVYLPAEAGSDAVIDFEVP